MIKKINPNLQKLAERTYNPNLKVDESILERQAEQTSPQTNAPELRGYIYVPSIKLYVSKERSLEGLIWDKTHKELQKQEIILPNAQKRKLRMPIIYEFKEYIRYLKQNLNGTKDATAEEIASILDEILTVRTPWRAEWLDAKFEDKKGVLYINYGHEFKNGQLIPKYSEKLEDCLMEDKSPGINLDYWLKNATSQGLPQKNIPKGELYYWYPRENKLAGFVAGSDLAGLYCDGHPDGSDPSLGVRLVVRPKGEVAKIRS